MQKKEDELEKRKTCQSERRKRSANIWQEVLAEVDTRHAFTERIMCRSTDFLRQVVSEKGRGWSAPTMVNKEDNTQHEWRCLRNAKRLAEAEPPAHAANWRHSQGPDGISGVQCALRECDDMIVALKLITYFVKRKQFRCGVQLDRQQVGGSVGNFHFGGQRQSLGHNG